MDENYNGSMFNSSSSANFAAGFMKSSSDADAGMGAGGSPSKRAERDLTPCTVAQLMSGLRDRQYLINNKTAKYVHLVGELVEIFTQDLSIHYVITDGTGTVTCQKFQEIHDPNAANAVRQNRYVTVYGTADVYNDAPVIKVESIREVTDHNEVTYHMLKTIHAHLVCTRGAMSGNNAASSSGVKAEVSSGYGYNNGLGNQIQNDVNADSEFTPLQDAVLKVFLANDSEQGCSITRIVEALGHSYQEQDVRGAVEFLNGEGHLYSTIDDDHFRSTSAM